MFDPYYKWLGIPPKEQPPNHYRLLGLALFDHDADVIDAAANRQMAYVQSRATGPHAPLSQRLLNELASARLCLLDPARRAAYDTTLKPERVAPAQDSAGPSPIPTPRAIVGRDDLARSGWSSWEGSDPETTPASTVPRRVRPTRSLESIREGQSRPPIEQEEDQSAFEHQPVRQPGRTIRRRDRGDKTPLIMAASVLTLSLLALVVAIQPWKPRGDSHTEIKFLPSSPIDRNPAGVPTSSAGGPAAVARAEAKHESSPRDVPEGIVNPVPGLQVRQEPPSPVASPETSPSMRTPTPSGDSKGLPSEAVPVPSPRRGSPPAPEKPGPTPSMFDDPAPGPIETAANKHLKVEHPAPSLAPAPSPSPASSWAQKSAYAHIQNADARRALEFASLNAKHAYSAPAARAHLKAAEKAADGNPQILAEVQKLREQIADAIQYSR